MYKECPVSSLQGRTSSRSFLGQDHWKRHTRYESLNVFSARVSINPWAQVTVVWRMSRLRSLLAFLRTTLQSTSQVVTLSHLPWHGQFLFLGGEETIYPWSLLRDGTRDLFFTTWSAGSCPPHSARGDFPLPYDERAVPLSGFFFA